MAGEKRQARPPTQHADEADRTGVTLEFHVFGDALRTPLGVSFAPGSPGIESVWIPRAKKKDGRESRMESRKAGPRGLPRSNPGKASLLLRAALFAHLGALALVGSFRLPRALLHLPPPPAAALGHGLRPGSAAVSPGRRMRSGPCARARLSLQGASAVLLDVGEAVSAEELRESADELFARSVAAYEQVALGDKHPESASAKDRDRRLVAAMELLEEVFRLDFEITKASFYAGEGGVSSRALTNVTCMRPLGAAHDDSRRPFIMGEELLGMELEPGRLCEAGTCCDACSRVQLHSLASDSECDEIMARANALMPELLEGPEAQQASPRQQHNLPLQFTAGSMPVQGLAPCTEMSQAVGIVPCFPHAASAWHLATGIWRPDLLLPARCLPALGCPTCCTSGRQLPAE